MSQPNSKNKRTGVPRRFDYTLGDFWQMSPATKRNKKQSDRRKK